jgi:hypothetical protein
MVTELDDQLSSFSEVNRIHCFLHIVNLIAKSLLKQFDVTKDQGDAGDQDLEKLLAELAKDFEHEESVTQELDNADDEEFDDLEDLPDVLTADKRADVVADIRKVTLVLAKVSAAHYENGQ